MKRLLAVLFLPATASAGPWTKNAGEAYVKLSEGVFVAGEFVDPRANAAGTISGGGVSHQSFTTALYAEVGVWDALHAQVYFPWVVGHNAYEGGGDYLSSGPGDLLASVQWSPRLFALPHALRAELKLPLYDVAEPKGFEGVRFPARGDGQLDLTLWLSAGDSLSALPIYYFAELGYRFRTEAYAGEGDDLVFGDSLAFFAQLGVRTLFDTIAAANLTGVVPLARTEVTKGYSNLGVSLFKPLSKNLAIEAAFDGTAWASASSRGLSLSLGLSYRL